MPRVRGARPDTRPSAAQLDELRDHYRKLLSQLGAAAAGL